MSIAANVLTRVVVGFRQSPKRHFRGFVGMLCLGLFFCLADLGLNRYAFDDGWSIFWPLNGVTLALLLMRPRSDWPYMLLGIAVGTGTGESLAPHPAPFEAVQRLISLVEILSSVLFLPPFTTLAGWLRAPHIYRRFTLALLTGPTVSGILYALLVHHARHKPYLLAVYQWASGDALGIGVTMPLVLALRSPELHALFSRCALRRTTCILVAALAGAAVSLSVSGYPLLFLLYPILLFVDLQLAFAGSAIAVFGVCLLSVYFATHHTGPFGHWPSTLPVSRDVAVQMFLSFHVLALFPASIATLERRRMSEDLRDANVQLRLLASLDGLTGLSNRRVLDERFAQEWNRAARACSPLALLMIDIDHFKEFNDIYGHHAGDRALKAVGAVLAANMQRADDLPARFGGEEFAVLLPNTDLDGALHQAEQVRQAVLALQLPHRGSSWGVITASIGCAAADPSSGHPLYAPDRVQLLNAADCALYQAKHGGRNRVEAGCVQQTSMDDEFPSILAEACAPDLLVP